MLKLNGIVALALAAVGLAAPAGAQTITSQQVITGLTRPIYLTHAPGLFDRIFVVEHRGSGGVAGNAAVKIYSLPSYTFVSTFLTVTGVSTGNEQGLLGLAFHPNYLTNGKLYVHYNSSASAGATMVAEYIANGTPATATTASLGPNGVIFTQSQPQSNHNGGWMSFGPDGYLYLALGDGGNANDTGTGHHATIGNGQDINTNLGKILRFDVDGDDFPGDANRDYRIPPTNPFAGAIPGNDEIWAYGLRNPWRNDFDPATGDLYIADVGQNIWEEVSLQPADINGSMGGRNYGWRCFESDAVFNTNGGLCQPYGVGNIPILLKYGHASSVAPTFRTGISITGGLVYRGCAIPGLQGTYFFADYGSNWIYSVQANPATNTFVNGTDRTAALVTGGVGNITSFGRDAYGELYIVSQGGNIHKIVRNGGTAPPDCNSNGRPDCQEILDGSVADANSNTVPDTCELPFAISLTTPPNGATNQSLTPLLKWTDSSNASSYSVKVATDPGLTNIVDSASGLGSSAYVVTGGALAAGQTYYWGATAVNANGSTPSTPTAFSFTTTPPAPCQGDINGDGQRNTSDLTLLLGAFGTCPGNPLYNAAANLDPGDPCINTGDLVAFLGVFGIPCP